MTWFWDMIVMDVLICVYILCMKDEVACDERRREPTFEKIRFFERRCNDPSCDDDVHSWFLHSIFLIPLIYRFWVFFFFINKVSSRTSEYLFTIVFRRSSFRFPLSLWVLLYLENRINIHVLIEMRYCKSHLRSFLVRIHMKIFFSRIYFALRSIATHSHFQTSSCR